MEIILFSFCTALHTRAFLLGADVAMEWTITFLAIYIFFGYTIKKNIKNYVT